MRRFALVLGAGGALLLGCSSGARRDGDLTKVPTPPPFESATTGSLVVSVKEGFVAAPVVRGLDMPAGITFDSSGNLCVLEAGGFIGNNPGRTPPRIRVIAPTGAPVRTIELKRVVFPATGIVFHEGSF